MAKSKAPLEAATRLFWMGKNLGIRAAIFRSTHALALRTGRVRHRTPVTTWDAYFAKHAPELGEQPEQCPSFLGKPPKDFLQISALQNLEACTQGLGRGSLTFFGHQPFNLGFPFAWHKSPLTGKSLPETKHWSMLSDFDPNTGDIKYFWEPSRFGWIYDLVRSHHSSLHPFNSFNPLPNPVILSTTSALDSTSQQSVILDKPSFPSQQLNDSTSHPSGSSTTQPLNASTSHPSGSSTSQPLNNSTLYPSQIFWELFEDWLTHNQPNCGVNWKCGQETALRAMALSFSLLNLWNSSDSTTQHKTKLLLALRFHAERIMATRLYALSQNNNHALSEAAGLLTIGALFPFFSESKKWFRIGFKQFCNEIMRQVYADGAYIQHSFNYHRLMLQLATWVDCILRASNRSFPAKARNRLAVSTSFLATFVDPKTGCVPNYGNNDGANILSLSSCDYTDYRPTIQAASIAFLGKASFPAGPYDEMAYWMNLSCPSELINPCSNPVILSTPSPLDSTTQHLNSSPINRKPPLNSSTILDKPSFSSQRLNSSTSSFPAGGYYLLTKGNYSVFTRCHTYRHRPGHADALHVDIWRNGQCIFGDSGTFSYLCQPQDDFSTTGAHNTIRINGQDQMTRISRFMWANWVKAGVTTFRNEKDWLLWEGWHNGYAKRFAVTHRRAILLFADRPLCVVMDKLDGTGSKEFELFWHHHSSQNNDWIACHTFGQAKRWEMLKLEKSTEYHSTYYGSKEEHVLFSAKGTAEFPVTTMTIVGHGENENHSLTPESLLGAFGTLPALNIPGKGPIFRK